MHLIQIHKAPSYLADIVTPTASVRLVLVAGALKMREWKMQEWKMRE